MSSNIAAPILLQTAPDSPQALLEFVLGLLLEYGYLTIFVGASLDFLLPSSGDIVMLAGGWFSNEGPLSLRAVMLFGALGGLMNDNTMYWVGRSGGRQFVERVLRHRIVARFLSSDRLDRVEKYFESHGGKTVVVGRFVPGLRAALPLSAGLSRMSYLRFVAFDVLAIAVWAPLMSTVGFVFGEYWGQLIAALNVSGRVVLGLLALLVVLYAYNRLRKRRPG
jgi:membrane-associated protein